MSDRDKSSHPQYPSHAILGLLANLDEQRRDAQAEQVAQALAQRQFEKEWDNAWDTPCYGPDDTDWPKRMLRLGAALTKWDLGRRMEDGPTLRLPKPRFNATTQDMARHLLLASIRRDVEFLQQFQTRFARNEDPRRGRQVIEEVFVELRGLNEWLRPLANKTTGPARDLMTIEDIALVCRIPLDTLRKLNSKPEPVQRGSGRKAHLYSFAEFRLALIEAYPDRAGIIPTDYAEAVAQLQQIRKDSDLSSSQS